VIGDTLVMEVERCNLPFSLLRKPLEPSCYFASYALVAVSIHAVVKRSIAGAYISGAG
jgi:hypothetical protein